MKKTIIAACSFMALTALVTACGSNNRRNLVSIQPIKRQKWDTHSQVNLYKKGTTQCSLSCPAQQSYGKLMEHKASSLTIKDYLK